MPFSFCSFVAWPGLSNPDTDIRLVLPLRGTKSFWGCDKIDQDYPSGSMSENPVWLVGYESNSRQLALRVWNVDGYIWDGQKSEGQSFSLGFSEAIVGWLSF